MKRELEIARCGLACCLCSENINCPGVIQGNVLIENGVKIGNVQQKKTKHIVIVVVKSVEKVCYQK